MKRPLGRPGEQFHQLPMFLSGRELKNYVTFTGDLHSPDDRAGFANYKEFGVYNAYDLDRQQERGVKLDVQPHQLHDESEFEPETMNEMWDRKVDESMRPRDTGHGAGVYNWIRTGLFGNNAGGKDELTVLHAGTDRQLTDGHHRVAAAADIEDRGIRNTWFYLSHR